MSLFLAACAKPLFTLVGVAAVGVFTAKVQMPFPPEVRGAPVPLLEAPAPRPPAAPAPPAKKKYPTAEAVPGMDGFCFNPFTRNKVDVTGIPSGTLVRDPADPDRDHKFRVP